MESYQTILRVIKAFKLDVLTCDHCGGSLKPIAALIDRDAITRYLTHVGLDPLPPARATPKSTIAKVQAGVENLNPNPHELGRELSPIENKVMKPSQFVWISSNEGLRRS